ncbi:SDR family NAD(P)-dependent oxidoreductase [Rhizorhabdus argentea]|uniref:SDR family NAD(P)-dependent oxidoreductase n=1 Tax=Rhizorhabdus argentea TaxID=1387174 RepID=UPI0030EE4C54
MSAEFAGKVALVVGGGSGIARASSELFAALGARVVVVDLNAAAAEETCLHIRNAGGEATAFVADATTEPAAAGMVDFVVATYGRLDIAHNNVGHPGPYGNIHELSLEAFEHCHRLNTVSCFLAMKYEIRHMLAAGGGAIVNTASLAGIIGSAGIGAYVSAKHSVIGLTKSAALELAAHNIRVNAICPGATDTPMLRGSMTGFDIDNTGLMEHWLEPMGRIGEAREQAEAAVWLCSQAASFVTGHIMPVDGGHVAGNRATKEQDESTRQWR